jgi:fluoroquinolone transport system permease protein
MRKTLILLKMGLRQLFTDGMLVLLLLAPLMIGLVFRFGIPVLNTLLTEKLDFSLLPWYPLIDAFMIMLTPCMVGMAGAFLILDECDEGTALYYRITPTEGPFYLAARIGIPMIWGVVSSIATVLIFGISGMPLLQILVGSLMSALAGTFVAMMVVSLAGNKVEGLAVSKLSGIIFAGMFVAWFAPAPYKYTSAFLPSFWLGEVLKNGVNFLPVVAGIIVCMIWIAGFAGKFMRKIQ